MPGFCQMRDFQSNQVDVCVHCPRNLLRGVPVVVDVFEDFIGIKKDLCCNDVCLVLRLRCHIEFDYDLWTTEDGKCMVRVKITGEVTEVARKVMRILRAEEKRLRRSKQGVPISGTEGKTAEERASVLSLSYVSYEGCEDLEPYWLIDSSSMEESVMFWMSEKEFRATLTPRQLDIYLNCIIGGQSKIDYAAANNMQRQSVYNAATLIMKKAKYFFKKF